MNSTGERFISNQKGGIELEHLNRYYFAINQFDIKDKIVLDIASGEGYGSNIIASKSKYVYGIDISKDAIEYASQRYQKKNIQFIQGAADKIPLKNNSIDIVVSFETIEHHNKHSEMLKEIKRVLKENGVLIMSSPDKLNYSDIPKFDNEFHVKELYYNEFKSLIKQFFKYHKFYGQSLFCGSLIFIDDDEEKGRIQIIKDNEDIQSLKPVYNLVICSDKEFENNHSNILFTKSEYFIFDNTQIDYIQMQEQIKMKKLLYSSWTWKIGRKILAPIFFFKKLFNA